MDNTLIVFASEHGTVEKCARRLFQLLDGKVDMCNLNDRNSFPDVSTYDSVIIGGSIRSGAIQESVAFFCAENLDILRKKRLGLFINCMYSDEVAQQQLDLAYPEELNKSAIVRDYFGGEIQKSKLSFWERIVMTQMIEKDDLVLALSNEKIENFAKKMKFDATT